MAAGSRPPILRFQSNVAAFLMAIRWRKHRTKHRPMNKELKARKEMKICSKKELRSSPKSGLANGESVVLLLDMVN